MGHSGHSFHVGDRVEAEDSQKKWYSFDTDRLELFCYVQRCDLKLCTLRFLDLS